MAELNQKDLRSSPWALYDALIEAIPPGLTVDEVLSGEAWIYVRSGDQVGLAMNLSCIHNTETRPRLLPQSCVGMPLKEMAAAAKSWNFAEASLGVAALNAFWNSPEHEAVAQALLGDGLEAFEAWADRVRGKKVAVIGHFPYVDTSFKDAASLSILEKRPGPGDYPDSACEFLLPQQDFVFATGVTVINKTVVRLLELSRRQGLVLAGPSTPLAPLLFDFGARDLQGLVVTDPDLCRDLVSGKTTGATIHDAGKRVSIVRNPKQ
jgi:uncharacterized protein (DUF4213/DUF364 family)